MKYLAGEFFKRDLTSLEMETLEKAMEESDETALGFLDEAARFWEETGQPDPVLRHQAGKWTVWRFWPVPLAAIAGAAVVFYFMARKPIEGPLPTGPMEVGNQVQVSTLPAHGSKLVAWVNLKVFSAVTVRVLDSSGKEVKVIFNGLLEPGKHSFVWDKTQSDGRPAVRGFYDMEVKYANPSGKERIRVEVK